jgi:hypothetical protein
VKKKTDPFVRTEKALAAFGKVVAELTTAAADHHAIVDEAYTQINELSELAARNHDAALKAERRASKIAEFL